jgi:hypothetical protein
MRLVRDETKIKIVDSTAYRSAGDVLHLSNLPTVGMNEYLSSGMASARPRKSPSANWSVPLTLSAMGRVGTPGRDIFVGPRSTPSDIAFLKDTNVWKYGDAPVGVEF